MKLSFDCNDIERIIGFKSQKFTMVNLTFTFLLGAVFTFLFYGVLFLLRSFYTTDYVEMFFHGGVQDRSPLPYFTVFLSCYSLAILLVKQLKLRNQRKAFDLQILPDDPNFVLSSRTAKEILDRIYLQVDQPRCYILLNRIDLALGNLKNLGNATAVSECLSTQAANDEDYLGSSYTILKGFIWAIPVLGFIGTVLGLSSAVGNFGKKLVSGASMEEITESLTVVTSGLSVAFETTLIALVLALLVQLYTKVVLNAEEIFLDDCADYCNRNIVAKIKNINFSDDIQ